MIIAIIIIFTLIFIIIIFITLIVLVYGDHHREGDLVVVETLGLLDGLVFAEDHGVPGSSNTVLDVRELLTEVLGLDDEVVAAVDVALAVLVVSVVVTTLPEVHEEEGDGPEDDEDEGEIVAGLVAGVDVEVSRDGNPEEDRETPGTLHETPAPREMFGANPGDKKR